MIRRIAKHSKWGKAGFILLSIIFLSYPNLWARQTKHSCTKDKDCPPGYVCPKNECITDPKREETCNPLSEEEGSCPEENTAKDLDSIIKSKDKKSKHKGDWEF